MHYIRYNTISKWLIIRTVKHLSARFHQLRIVTAHQLISQFNDAN